jgi:hypothetical protein
VFQVSDTGKGFSDLLLAHDIRQAVFFSGIEFGGDAVGLVEHMAEEKGNGVGHHTAFIMSALKYFFNVKDVLRNVIGGNVFGRWL